MPRRADSLTHALLRETVPHLADPGVGCVQARWGHANRGYSPLTRLQALMMDGHFVVEQGARDPAVPELPDGAVEDEVVDVHQREEDDRRLGGERGERPEQQDCRDKGVGGSETRLGFNQDFQLQSGRGGNQSLAGHLYDRHQRRVPGHRPEADVGCPVA